MDYCLAFQSLSLDSNNCPSTPTQLSPVMQLSEAPNDVGHFKFGSAGVIEVLRLAL